jgi:hypothetical protein
MLEKSSTILCKVSWVDISVTIPLLGHYPFSRDTHINRVSLEKKEAPHFAMDKSHLITCPPKYIKKFLLVLDL